MEMDMMTKTNKFLDLGSYYINIDQILYFTTYNKNTQGDKDNPIPDDYDFAIHIEWVGDKQRATTFFLTAEEWQCAYAQIQMIRIGAISEIT
jgi:hypothetical protein